MQIRTEEQKLVDDFINYAKEARRYGCLARRMWYIARDEQMAKVFYREAEMNLIAMRNQLDVIMERTDVGV